VRQLSLNPVLFCEVNKERKLFMSNKTIDLNQVQLTLQELLALIKVDTEIIITEGNKPVARLIPWGDTEKTTSETPSPKLGLAKILMSHFLKNFGQVNHEISFRYPYIYLVG
jgi:antitoxin (DNA-binding transcriptional repressor) of toxin-antitoxin stability system